MGKAIGKQLEYGERADIENLRSDEDLWEDNSIFEIEKKIIKEHLEHCEEEKSNEKCNCRYLIENLKMYIFVAKDMKDRLQQAKKTYGQDLKGEYQKLGPTKWLIGFIIAVLLETSILVIQSVSGGGFNPVILLFAGMLAIGGWMLGDSLGYFFYRNEAIKKGVNSRTIESKKLTHVVMGSIGLILILFVASIRSFGDEGFYFDVFFITLILGVLVSALEGRRKLETMKRDEIIEFRIIQLKDLASAKHKNSLEQYIQMLPKECEKDDEVSKLRKLVEENKKKQE